MCMHTSTHTYTQDLLAAEERREKARAQETEKLETQKRLEKLKEQVSIVRGVSLIALLGFLRP